MKRLMKRREFIICYKTNPESLFICIQYIYQVLFPGSCLDDDFLDFL